MLCGSKSFENVGVYLALSLRCNMQNSMVIIVDRI